MATKIAFTNMSTDKRLFGNNINPMFGGGNVKYTSDDRNFSNKKNLFNSELQRQVYNQQVMANKVNQVFASYRVPLPNTGTYSQNLDEASIQQQIKNQRAYGVDLETDPTGNTPFYGETQNLQSLGQKERQMGFTTQNYVGRTPVPIFEAERRTEAAILGLTEQIKKDNAARQAAFERQQATEIPTTRDVNLGGVGGLGASGVLGTSLSLSEMLQLGTDYTTRRLAGDLSIAVPGNETPAPGSAFSGSEGFGSPVSQRSLVRVADPVRTMKLKGPHSDVTGVTSAMTAGTSIVQQGLTNQLSTPRQETDTVPGLLSISTQSTPGSMALVYQSNREARRRNSLYNLRSRNNKG
jgi:hypothetical protein